MALASATTLLAVERTALGEDSDELLGLLNETIVTTASQTAESASTAPALSTVIRADDLRRHGVHTLAEAVDFLSLGVSSAGGKSPAGTVELGSRGVLLPGDSGNHFLLLIDGHAVNEPYYGSARFDHMLGLPLEAVDHIEVIVGPGSVLYGSNAMLGVINVITKSAEALRGVTAVVETELPVHRRAAALGGVSFRLLDMPGELTGAVQYWDEYGPSVRVGPQNVGIDIVTERPVRTRRGGPEDGIWAGRLEESTFTQVPSGMLRLRVGDTTLSVRGSMATWGKPYSAADFDDPQSATRERWASADLSHRSLLSARLVLSARIYADTYDQLDRTSVSRPSACPFDGVETCQLEKRVASRWAGAQVSLGYDWLKDGTMNTLVGVDGRTRFAGAKEDLLDFETRAPQLPSAGIVDESAQAFGAYVQQIWLPVPRVGLNAGARLDQDPRFPAVVSPRAAASFGLWQGGTLKGSYAEAFRAPSYEETHFGNLLRATSEDLEPETVRSVEGSVEHRFGAHRVLFGGFRSWWKNLVELRYLSFQEALAATQRGQLALALPNLSHTQYQNASSIDSYGLHASLEGSLAADRVRYGVNVTEAFARRSDDDGDSRPLPAAPRFYGNARISYDLGDSLPTLGLGSYLLASRPADRAYDAGLDPPPFAPTLVDLRLTASGDVPLVPGLSYRLSFDTVLADEGAYVIGPVLVGTPENPSAELTPLTRFRGSIGLEYRFPAE